MALFSSSLSLAGITPDQAEKAFQNSMNLSARCEINYGAIFLGRFHGYRHDSLVVVQNGDVTPVGTKFSKRGDVFRAETTWPEYIAVEISSSGARILYGQNGKDSIVPTTCKLFRL